MTDAHGHTIFAAWQNMHDKRCHFVIIKLDLKANLMYFRKILNYHYVIALNILFIYLFITEIVPILHFHKTFVIIVLH